VCENVDNGTCGEEICRTPGFWGARGGNEKGGQNITQAVMDSVGGLDVCGGTIDNTNLRDSMSALEAICINGGDPKGKLIRHLTSSALNCALGTCSANTADLVSICNDACMYGADELYSDCSASLDCFNNGGVIQDDGSCVAGGPDNCHDRELCAEGDNDCAVDTPIGSASSSKACNTARKDKTYVWEYTP
jgi:hypothetical protein